MSKAKLLPLLVVVALVAGVGGALLAPHHLARGHHLPPKAGHYVVAAHCTNCGWEGEMQVPKGETVAKVTCPRCELRNRPEPGPFDPNDPFRNTSLNWTSSLITQEKWDERQAAIASGRRR
jgi:hypothetical protein